MMELLDFLTHHAGAIGLLFFFVFFVVMVGWVFRPGMKTAYQTCATIPLKECEE